LVTPCDAYVLIHFGYAYHNVQIDAESFSCFFLNTQSVIRTEVPVLHLRRLLDRGYPADLFGGRPPRWVAALEAALEVASSRRIREHLDLMSGTIDLDATDVTPEEVFQAMLQRARDLALEIREIVIQGAFWTPGAAVYGPHGGWVTRITADDVTRIDTETMLEEIRGETPAPLADEMH
jgi:hypothetical protein